MKHGSGNPWPDNIDIKVVEMLCFKFFDAVAAGKIADPTLRGFVGLCGDFAKNVKKGIDVPMDILLSGI